MALSGSVLGRWPEEGEGAVPSPRSAPVLRPSRLELEVVRSANELRTEPAVCADRVGREVAKIDPEGLLRLDGWPRPVKLRHGADAHRDAETALRRAPPTRALRICIGLQQAAEVMAKRAAEAKTPGATGPLLATAREYCRPVGAISLNAAAGWYACAGEQQGAQQVVQGWAVSDGDPDREYRDNALRPEATAIGVGSAYDADGRVYIICIFADEVGDIPAPSAALPRGEEDTAFERAAQLSLSSLHRAPAEWGERVRRSADGADADFVELGAAHAEAAEQLGRHQSARGFKFSEGLRRAALAHARDLAHRGAGGHRGNDGSLPEDRAALHGIARGKVSECVAQLNAGETPEAALVRWLADDGDLSRRQREAVLEGGCGGVACCRAENGTMWVVGLFAEGYEDRVRPQDGEERGDVASDLLAAFDGDGDGAICLAEYIDLARAIGLPLEPDPPAAFARATAAHPHPSGGLGREGLWALAGGVLSSAEATARDVAAARRTAAAVAARSDSVCPEKQAACGLTASTSCDVPSVVGRIQRLWEAKQGDVVDELVANLRGPGGAADANLLALAEAARQLDGRCGGSYEAMNLAELLCMALYTMAGPDIDGVMGYSGVPVYSDSNKEAWEEYCGRVGGDRNPALFGTVNWAMRTAAPAPEAETDAWSTVQRWVKYLALMAALCCQTPSNPGTLSRGLAGLPAAVVEAHRSLSPDSRVDWPSPSSCATDPSVAEAYIKGAAANATKTAGGQVFFAVHGVRSGLPLQSISKYPKEAEVLLSPLTSFRVRANGSRADLPPGCVVLDVDWMGANLPPDFLRRVRDDTVAASEKLRERTQRLREEERRVTSAMRGADFDPERFKPGEDVFVLRSGGGWHPGVIATVDTGRRVLVITFTEGEVWEGTPTEGRWVAGKERRWNPAAGVWETHTAVKEKSIPFGAVLASVRKADEHVSSPSHRRPSSASPRRYADPARCGSFGAEAGRGMR
eukprot:Hpha_TRINITY_DN22806_c0_g1::TRINITY_DN22806_c0_g1_i1::g.84261::m.84261